MKKKVIGFIILLLVFVLGLSISCYAYTFGNSSEMLTDIQEKMQVLKDKGILGNQFQIPTNMGYILDSGANVYWLLLDDTYIYVGSIINSNYDLNNPIVNENNSWGQRTNGRWRNAGGCKWTRDTGGNSYSTVSTFGDINILYAYTTININTATLILNELEEYGGSFINSSLFFEPYNDGFITVYNNGSGESFLNYKLSRSVNSWALGKLDGLDDSMRVDVRLGFFIPTTQNYTSTIGHAQSYYGKTTSTGGLSIANDGVVYINNSKIYYEQGYILSVDFEGETIDNYFLYFLPYGSNKVSGDLFSPDLDSNEYLDIVQNLQELISISNIGNIYDEHFSGDSGEILGFFGYNEYNNQYSNYLNNLFGEVKNTLTGSGDVSFTFPYMSTNITLHSNDFITPNNGLKIFVRDFLIFGYFVLLYKSISHFYHRMQEGNILAAMNTVAVDDESLLM